MTRNLTSNVLLTGALVPAALLFAIGCGGSTDATDATDATASTSSEGGEHAAHDDHDGHDHADHEGADDEHTPSVVKDVPVGPATGAANDAHAGHDHADHGPEGPPPIKVDEEMLASGEGPRLTYDVGRDKVEFGRVTQGAVLHHTFDLESAGNTDLVITQIKPTCGCTVAKLLVANEADEMVEYTYGDPIKPGTKMELPAKMHTKNKRGNQNVRINIFSNDPRATMQLGMLSTIDPFFNINPSFMTFGKISVGEEVTKTASISTAKGQPMLLTLLEHTRPAGAQVELKAKNPDEEGRSRAWELTVSLGPDLAEGNLARQMQLVSDILIEGQEPREGQEPMMYEASLTVSAEIVGPFTYSPSYLSMGLVRPGEVKTRSVRIDGHDLEFPLADNLPSLRITGLPVQGEPGVYNEWDLTEYFVASVKPVEGQNSIDVELRLEGLPEEKRGSFGGMLVVDLGHPSKKEIPLRITGVCRGGPK